jgi:hypothetical protein
VHQPTIGTVGTKAMIIISLLYLRFRKNAKVAAFMATCFNTVRKHVGVPSATISTAV